MANTSKGLKRFKHTLQAELGLSDVKWSYHVPNLPSPKTCNSAGVIKSIELIAKLETQTITLQLRNVDHNRALSGEPLDRFIHVSFSSFRVHEPKEGKLQPTTARESADYLVHFLKSGIDLNGVHYSFYGHSNSQLKSRSCYLLAGSKQEVSRKIEGLGDFSKMTSVAKKAKRIGLLFSVSHAVLNVPPDKCEDIEDVENANYNFTDGCGNISPELAARLVRDKPILFRSKRYRPSVFQIRYRGYKGVVSLDPGMKKGLWLQFRKSMRKFTGTDDLSFAVVEYSKPYSYGYLNDESILLLHSLGISSQMLLQKQARYFEYLHQATSDFQTAFRFLCSLNLMDLAEKVLLEGIEPISGTIRKLVNQEYDKMINKRDEQKCRILIPNSRLLFGICDPYGLLEPNECFVRITHERDGMPITIKGIEVLVTRNPCLHPGDLRKIRAADCPQLAHLTDCIVFSTKGKRPAADTMSGGDLDGDTFFVCFDSDIIPSGISEPAEYPGAKEAVSLAKITDEDRVEYLARYTSASLGRVKKTYLGWARVKGALSKECQELNRLFSLCVDGNRVTIPKRLEDPPTPAAPDELRERFILDRLHEDAVSKIKRVQHHGKTYRAVSKELLQAIMCDSRPVSEFEMAKMAFTWSKRNRVPFSDFLDYINLDRFTTEQRLWLLRELPVTAENLAIVWNGLLTSAILNPSELQPHRLNLPGLRWKRVFSSEEDRLGNLFESIQRCFANFERKFFVFQIGERLSVAIYIPQKIEQDEDFQVDNTVRLFAFPHTHERLSGHRRVVPTKMNYRLYYDQSTFQLYQSHRQDTFVYFARAANDTSKFQSVDGKANRARVRQETIDVGMNSDWIVSIALGKFSGNLATHMGRVNREPVIAAELYIISNTDLEALRTVDLWLESIDTLEVHPLFEKEAPEFRIARSSDIDWTVHAEYLQQVVRDGSIDILDSDSSMYNLGKILDFCFENNEVDRLMEIYTYLLSPGKISTNENPGLVIPQLISFLLLKPNMSIHFARLCPWNALPPPVAQVLVSNVSSVLQALINHSYVVGDLILEPFKSILAEASSFTLESFCNLVGNMALAMQSPELALELFLECLEPRSISLLKQLPMVSRYLVKHVFGAALDHLEEASEQSSPGLELWNLKIITFKVERAKLKSERRIDAPSLERLATGDHVRFTMASAPSNAPLLSFATFHALVETSKPGEVTFRCIQHPPAYVEQCTWKMKHCGSAVTTKAMIDAAAKLVSEKEGCCEIFEHLVTNARPQAAFPSNRTLLDFHSQDLNERQNVFVKTCLNEQRGVVCLWGPPGCGKTFTIVRLLQALLEEFPDERVLVTAPTHNATDNILRKYIECCERDGVPTHSPIRVSTDVRRVNADLRSYTCDAMEGKDLIAHPEARRKALARIQAARLIFTTCTGAGLGLLKSERFEIVIIDEASQQTEPASLIPLVKGCRRAILVGDHVQLRTTVRPRAKMLEHDVSLFERLYVTKGNEDVVKKVMLNTQYRMHPAICAFPSSAFYDGLLLSAATCADNPLWPSLFPWPVDDMPKKTLKRCVLVPCPAPEDMGRKSKSNPGQAQLCKAVYHLLNASSTPAVPQAPGMSPKSPAAPVPSRSHTIAILTPYTRQLELLEKSCPGARISTIDSFQGQEADIIIYVTVRSNPHGSLGFLTDMRRLNVVLTRAKSGLILIGDKDTLSGGPPGNKGMLVSSQEESESSEAENLEKRVWRNLIGTLAIVDLAMPAKEKDRR